MHRPSPIRWTDRRKSISAAIPRLPWRWNAKAGALFALLRAADLTFRDGKSRLMPSTGVCARQGYHFALGRKGFVST